MKNISRLVLTSFLFTSLVVASRASDVDMTVVAEQSAPGAKLARPSPTQPATYVAYDGGYIEAGDPVASEKPPTPSAVRHALVAALASAGYQPVNAPAAPSLLLIYHWGAIRHDSFRPRIPFRIDTNLRARIALVATPRVVRKAEDFFRGPKPAYTEPDLRDAFDLAKDPRYFVIVSAYDYSELDHQQATLLWRARFSAQENSGAMDEVLISLIDASPSYLGRQLSRPEHPAIPRANAAEVSSTANSPLPPEFANAAIAEFVHTLALNEHDEFAGLRDPEFDHGASPGKK